MFLLMGRMLKGYPEISLRAEDLDGRIDFAYIFGRAAPVHIDVGCGKAAFLLNQAKAQPGLNFLGLERANKFYRYAVDRIGRWGLENVRIIRIDAGLLLADFVADASVNCLHIYFPDPWPKKRHHKRRFLCQANLAQMARCLSAGGVIKIATDHAGYFEVITNLVEANSSQFESVDFSLAAGATAGELVGTNFERKYLKEQRPIYTLAVRKIGH